MIQTKQAPVKSGIHNAIRIILLTMGILLLSYFAVWCTGALLWSFDEGICFILACGIILTLLGILWCRSIVPWGRRHRLARNVIVAISVLFLFSFVAIDGFLIGTALQNDSKVKADYVLIPGAAIVQDKPSRVLKQRLDIALSYILNNSSAQVIVSGAKGANEVCSEAEVMKRYLIENGVEDNRIIMEEKAGNSEQNIKYSKEIIEQNSATLTRKLIIVTNDYHMLRMKLLAKAQGLEPYGIPAPIHYSVAPICYVREYFPLIKLFAGK